MEANSPDAVLAGLDEEQREAATCFGAPQAIIAAAGAGKTRTVTARLAFGALSGELSPQHCLALTFTTGAAGQLRSRLAAAGAPPVVARTIHSAALRQLRFFWPQTTKSVMPTLVGDRAPLIAEALQALRLTADAEAVRDAAGHIGWAKAHMLDPHGLGQRVAQAQRLPSRDADPDQVAQVYAEYERVKHERSVMDLDDVLVYLIGLLADNDDVLSQVRRSYRHLTVDEFQDTSLLQFTLLQLWAGPRRDICVVGDPAQSIYGFAGADPRFLRDFEDLFPGAEVFRLGQSYRCAPQIVAVADAVSDAQESFSAVAGAQQGCVSELIVDADSAELTAVCELVAARLAAGVPAQEVAVLARAQDRVAQLETALRAAGVPVVMRGPAGFFERREVKQALLELRATASSGELLPAMTEVAERAGWHADQAQSSSKEHWDSYSTLVQLAQQLFEQDPASRVEDFLAEVFQRSEAMELPPAPAVSVMTMHAAKGLEWDCVVVTGLVAGVVPHALATSRQALADERRLLFVAMTRARRELFLSWYRTRGGRPCQRSPFLPQIAGGQRA